MTDESTIDIDIQEFECDEIRHCIQVKKVKNLDHESRGSLHRENHYLGARSSRCCDLPAALRQSQTFNGLCIRVHSD